MAHEPKLTVFTIHLKPANNETENSNRWLFRNIIGEANENVLEDSFLFIEVFKKFITALDKPEMFSDDKSKKCITANQPDLTDDNVAPNIIPHSEQFIIEGTIEGGAYGRNRNKTSTVNKINKEKVNDEDAITDEFYFFIYMPLESNKMILMLQSYEGDSIDGIFNIFWKNFFSYADIFKSPTIKRYYPESIINSFKASSAVSGFQYTTEIPSKTLFGRSIQTKDQKFKVTVKIVPTDDDLTVDEFERIAPNLGDKSISRLGKFLNFKNRKGILRDTVTNKQSPFSLDSNFHIQPVILLSKFINFPNDKIDFTLIKNYCYTLLEEIKIKIYPEHAVEER